MPSDQFPKGTENFEERNKKITEIRDRLYYSEHTSEIHEYIVAQTKFLKAKYPDHEEREVDHILISSTPFAEEQTIKDDFPGDDSVEKFLTDLARKYRI